VSSRDASSQNRSSWVEYQRIEKSQIEFEKLPRDFFERRIWRTKNYTDSAMKSDTAEIEVAF